MHIDFHDKTNSVPDEYIDTLENILQFAAEQEKVSKETEMSVNFVDDKEIQSLNRDYRQKDNPTDVISFAMQETSDGEMQILDEELPVLLGDIVISIDRAKVQAAEYNHSLKREIAFLTIHGFLHLIGYNHQNEEEEKRMFGRQNEILSEFGIER